MITQAKLKRLLHYDPETGDFTWLERTPDMFEDGKRNKETICKTWNSKYAGTVAGSVDGKGYIQIMINHIYYMAHRLAWLYENGEIPDYQLDHINNDKQDNRIFNLRKASGSQNCANKALTKSNTSGYKGVYYEKVMNKYRASIRINGKKIRLGFFDDPAEAHETYKKAAEELFREFARFK